MCLRIDLRWTLQGTTSGNTGASLLDDTPAGDRVTSARMLMVSAIPAGLVMSRDDVLGMQTPSAARMGTTIRVVRFPGMPRCSVCPPPDLG